MTAAVEMILYPDWPVHARVRAAQSLRLGGVSQGPFEALNLGAHVGDAPEAVAENRSRLRRVLDLPAEPLWLEQVHGIEVIDADSDVSRRADAVVTAQSATVCVIQTADCLPVLFADSKASRVAAAHAGWRGLAAGVLEATVQAMDRPAESLIAWFGPAIGVEAFEVGSEVRDAFVAHDDAAAAAFAPNARGRWQADIYLLARQRLAAIGVDRIYGGGWCTYLDSKRFFSHRRDGRSGRMATLVWLDR